MEQSNEEKIKQEFLRIKKLGYIKSNRSNNTGIGKTFEDYLGVGENNIKGPDFVGYEVKSQRELTKSFLTLFTKSPSGPRGANTYLRDNYGEIYENNPSLKKIHTSIFSNRFNTYRDLYKFKIVNDRVNEKLLIQIRDISSNHIIDESVYWTYKAIESCLKKKLQKLFYVSAHSRQGEDGKEEFNYYSSEIYLDPSLENLLSLVDQGKIMVDIRIGSYKSGVNTGKTHDHGTGFRIKPSDLINLYEKHIEVKEEE